jgi:t-SNARE complex subunit (syntaxin)
MVLVDRIKEITAKAGVSLVDLETDESDEEQPLVNDASEHRKPLMEFLALDAASQTQLVEISSLLSQLRESLVVWYSASVASEEHAALSKIEDLCLWISESIRSVKRSLSLINFEVDKSVDSLDIRMRRNVHASLLTRLNDRVKEFRVIQEELSTASKARAIRQIQISIDVSADRAQDLIDNGVTPQAVYSQSLAVERSEDLYNKLSSIREKVSALRRIQRSVEDVHQLLTSLSELVQQQASVLDNIEVDVVNAKNFSAEASRKLRETDRRADKRLRGRVSCLICLLLVLLVLGLIGFFHKQIVKLATLQ